MESNCLNFKGGAGQLIEGICDSGCKNKNFIKKNDSDECFDILTCFEKLFLKVPKIFNIEEQDYKSEFVYELKEDCLEFEKDFEIKWKEIEGMIVSEDYFSVEIPAGVLKNGNLELIVSVEYNGKTIKSLTETSFLITNKVSG